MEHPLKSLRYQIAFTLNAGKKALKMYSLNKQEKQLHYSHRPQTVLSTL